MFSTQIYRERREKLKKLVKGGLLLFLGNRESPMNYPDNTYHFRQDSSFLYFFGLDQPDLAALIDLDENREIIFGDELTMDQIVWMGDLPKVLERAESAGVGNTQPLADLAGIVKKVRAKKRPIHFLPPYRADNQILLSELLDLPPGQLGEKSSLEFIKAIVSLRNHKQPEEVAEIDQAVKTTARMHLEAMKMARPGVPEYEIAAKIHQVALAGGGDIGYPIIATVNGQTLHNHFHGNTLREGDLFLVDAGAETARHYCGDLSSTMPVSGHFTARQKEVYQIALEAHAMAVSLLRPGIPFREVHLSACRVIAAGLKGLGLMKGDPAEAVAAGAHAMFFPCGTGHMMGLDVHDMENLGEQWVGYDGQPKSTQFGLKSLRLARPLEPGFVVTVEPGIYFIPQLIDLWQSQGKFVDFIDYAKLQSYRDFHGLRNEENYLITEDGCRRLGDPLPMTIEKIEALRN